MINSAADQMTDEANGRPSIMARTIVRPEDTPRLPATLRPDDQEKPRASSADTRLRSDTATSLLSECNAIDAPDDPTVSNKLELLSISDTTELFKSRLQEAQQQTQDALASSEGVSEVMRPTLTLDLGHSNIARLPESVVDLIKAEVERLSLSHNQIWHIPLKFAECSQLRYLNIRTNVFRELPPALYKLRLLEILDISRNKVRKISGDIKLLTSLRVFSIVKNRINELPVEICEMTKLQILKVNENPLGFKVKRMIEAKEREVEDLDLNDSEKGAAITAEIKRYLRKSQLARTPLETETASESGELALETPKPLKRVPSSRFPVRPSINGIEVSSGSEATPKSPGQSKPPPIPTRSHYRIVSAQTGHTVRRPSASPLGGGNDSGKSSNESISQSASTNVRSKRMGMIRKGVPDVDAAEEPRNNRVSHLRGLSHGSVLRSRGGGGGPSGNNLANPVSPKDGKRGRGPLLRKLSGLTEPKKQLKSTSSIVEGARGILYVLYQVHPQMSSLITVIKNKDPKRSALESASSNAAGDVERLNDALEQAETLWVSRQSHRDRLEGTVKKECIQCIASFSSLLVQVQENHRRIVLGADARYIRTLIPALYGGLAELRNSLKSFNVEVRVRNTPRAAPTAKGAVLAHPASSPPTAFQASFPPHSTIPPSLPLERHLRSTRSSQDSAIKLDAEESRRQLRLRTKAASSHDDHAFPPNASSAGHSSTPSAAYSAASRSRSNTAFNVLSPNLPTSTSTPRTGEGADGFNLSFAPKVNPATGMSDAQEVALFGAICGALNRACETSNKALPVAKRAFSRSLEAAEENRFHRDICEVLKTVMHRCGACLQASETLQESLVTIHLKASSGAGRSDRIFWQRAKTFTQSFIDLVAEMKEAKSKRLLPQDVVLVLRPVQKASREAVGMIDASPWALLAEAGVQPLVRPLLPANGDPNGMLGNHSPNIPSSYTNGIPSSLHSAYWPPPTNGLPSHSAAPSLPAALQATSPSSLALPATPLSAALGPAAQATIPSTPASAYGESFFRGDVFARADALLSTQPQNGGFTFNNRRG